MIQHPLNHPIEGHAILGIELTTDKVSNGQAAYLRPPPYESITPPSHRCMVFTNINHSVKILLFTFTRKTSKVEARISEYLAKAEAWKEYLAAAYDYITEHNLKRSVLSSIITAWAESSPSAPPPSSFSFASTEAPSSTPVSPAPPSPTPAPSESPAPVPSAPSPSESSESPSSSPSEENRDPRWREGRDGDYTKWKARRDYLDEIERKEQAAADEGRIAYYVQDRLRNGIFHKVWLKRKDISNKYEIPTYRGIFLWDAMFSEEGSQQDHIYFSGEEFAEAWGLKEIKSSDKPSTSEFPAPSPSESLSPAPSAPSDSSEAPSSPSAPPARKTALLCPHINQVSPDVDYKTKSATLPPTTVPSTTPSSTTPSPTPPPESPPLPPFLSLPSLYDPDSISFLFFFS